MSTLLSTRTLVKDHTYAAHPEAARVGCCARLIFRCGHRANGGKLQHKLPPPHVEFFVNVQLSKRVLIAPKEVACAHTQLLCIVVHPRKHSQ